VTGSRKALLALLALIAVIVAVSRLPDPPGSARYNAGGYVWKIGSHEWIQRDGFYRLDAVLTPVSGEGFIRFDPEMLRGICGEMMTHIPFPPTETIMRADVYRVSINVEIGGEMLSKTALPVTVRRGACVVENETYEYTYYGPLADWTLSRFEYVDSNPASPGKKGGALTLEFDAARGEAPAVDGFPFPLACEVVLDDPPPAIVAVFETYAPRVLVIRVRGAETGRTEFMRFGREENKCVELPQGDAT
jgi:hypothetical protein